MGTTETHATLLTGRLGSLVLLQLDIGGMNPVITRHVQVDELEELHDEIAQEFAGRLVEEGVSTTYVHYLDGTYLVVLGRDRGQYNTLNPQGMGGKYAEKLHRRVIQAMRKRRR